MDDQPDRHGQDVGILPQPLGIGHLVAVGDGARAYHRRAAHAARAAVDHVDTLGLQDLGQRNALVGAPAGIVLDREAHEQRLGRRPVGAHAFHHLDGEPHPVKFAAAILVVAHVGERREELVDQVAVRHVEIENVEARLVGAPRRLAPALDDFGNLGPREGARSRIGRWRVDAARRDQLPPFPIPDLRRRLQRRAAFPRPEAPRLAARVAELEARHRIVQADEVGAALEARDVGIVPETEVPHRTAAAALDLGRFHDDQPRATGGEPARIHQVPVGGEALLRRILVHGRHDDPVLERHVANGNRFEQLRLSHV